MARRQCSFDEQEMPANLLESSFQDSRPLLEGPSRVAAVLCSTKYPFRTGTHRSMLFVESLFDSDDSSLSTGLGHSYELPESHATRLLTTGSEEERSRRPVDKQPIIYDAPIERLATHA